MNATLEDGISALKQARSELTGLTLADLLAVPELGLELLTEERTAHARPIAGAHSIEIERPSLWLAPDWVMLTTGIRLLGDEAAQRTLVRELHASSVAALGVARGTIFDEVPDAIVQEAEALSFAVFSVPAETPFREVMSSVQRSVLSSELRMMQRLASIQRYLVDALDTPAPRPLIVQRLASVLDGAAAIVTPQLELECSSGVLPERAVEALHGARAVVHETVLPQQRVIAVPLEPQDEGPCGWIVVAIGAPEARRGLARAAAKAAAPLVRAAVRLQDTMREQDRALRRALLDELLGGGPVAAVQPRAVAFGIDLSRPHRVVALARADPDGAEGRTIEDLVALRLHAAGVAHLQTSARDRTVVLLEADGAGVQALRSLVAGDGALVAGAGREAVGAEDVAHSAADAHVLIDVASAGDGDGGGWRDFDALDLPRTLLAHVPEVAIGPKTGALADALDSRPGLREAVIAWFAHELDTTAAAQALHLHPNSLRYRLSRVAEAIGSPLRSPATITSLYLLLEAERRHEPPPA
ncbi:PucR family transcriptional regulator ligand-binding domain-containing protein [Conexibacter stalactiti]|uniref:PucR family transcriptional regulator ligand-binding domain-containing protein n=1 Tax=Conexibacter stalactiti TaxID=1940611 RepID=A0ABU4HJE5_9ACTN|nr:PucR family transcriptional regulator ligand-binding domain-containing protein [Conexibacter stalactiti]MDW5593440.1 PucR family transcriptional regulator ligand-binding domain-containing protein [Conexibacter stalactiti]MEC5034081.1 PucR family transcriptional regulator ligand-binding domain-containing protein [Conexibacter stalactiti]